MTKLAANLCGPTRMCCLVVQLPRIRRASAPGRGLIRAFLQSSSWHPPSVAESLGATAASSSASSIDGAAASDPRSAYFCSPTSVFPCIDGWVGGMQFFFRMVEALLLVLQVEYGRLCA